MQIDPLLGLLAKIKWRSTNWQLRNRGVKYSTGNAVCNVAVTVRGPRSVLELLGREQYGKCMTV